MSVSPKSGWSVARIVVAGLLASAATGCSSDASRFSGIFGQDTLTTASINRQGGATLRGPAPVPSTDVGGVASASPQYDYNSRSAAVEQPYPASPSGESPARMASQPSAVQRNELAAPSMASAPSAATERQLALAQPMPAAPKADPVVTGSNPMPSADAAAARTAADANALRQPTRLPLPKPAQEEKVAVLPNGAASRDKQASAEPLKPVAGGDGGAGKDGYTVKPGDSLAKIARDTGTPIDELKKANGLTSATIRVGQTLKLPAGKAAAPAAGDAVKTASVPAAAKKPAPAAYTPPAPSVSEVAAADTESSAPEATGIGKYRWPVTGAVVAKYGQNVEGKRSDGIDISVPAGTAVKAAENGVVIYAGNGLKELGNTVLVRHDDGTVTVYGHADALAVQRGQKVQRGQQLATSGMSGSASRPMLHFEVRKDATPVDPMTFLE